MRRRRCLSHGSGLPPQLNRSRGPPNPASAASWTAPVLLAEDRLVTEKRSPSTVCQRDHAGLPVDQTEDVIRRYRDGELAGPQGFVEPAQAGSRRVADPASGCDSRHSPHIAVRAALGRSPRGCATGASCRRCAPGFSCARTLPRPRRGSTTRSRRRCGRSFVLLLDAAPASSRRAVGGGRNVVPTSQSSQCCRARGTDRNWARVDRKMLWSPAASSSQQRARVLTDVKARRFAPPPLRGADGLDAGSAHGSSRLALADDAHSYTPYMLWSTSRPE